MALRPFPSFAALLTLGVLACTPAPVASPNVGCEFSSDCEGAEQCVRGRCIAAAFRPTRCADHEDCMATQRCSALYGECVDGPRSCTAEAECTAAGLHCNTTSGVCAACNIDAHCGETSICIDSLCAEPLTAQCGGDVDCAPPSTVCMDGSCVEGCLLDGCTVGMMCDRTTGRCAPNTNTCTDDRNCAPPTTVCEASGCVPGCGQRGAACTGSDVCDTTTGRCEPASPRDPLNAICAGDGDCASDLCFDFGGAAGRRCIASCGSSVDCPVGFTCHVQDGARMCVNGMLFSGGATFTLQDGATCGANDECRSGLCTNQSCVERCTVDDDCSTGMCHWDEIGQQVWDQRCNGPGGSRSVGATCNIGQECQSGVCIRGSGAAARCLRHCDDTNDCTNGTVCAPIDYSICTSGTPDDCNSWRVQSVKACVEDNHGTGGIGTSCTRSADCRSLLCNSNLSECTDTCSTDADCPSGFGCKVDTLFELPQATGTKPFYFNVCLPRTN